jgi:hypothetical protein
MRRCAVLSHVAQSDNVVLGLPRCHERAAGTTFGACRSATRASAYAPALRSVLLADAVVEEQRGGLEGGAGDRVLCPVLPSGTDDVKVGSEREADVAPALAPA